MMKQKPTMKQRLFIVGHLSVIIRNIQDNTFDVDSIDIVKEFVEKYDCSGRVFDEVSVSKLVGVILQGGDRAIFSAALLIFIFSDVK